MPRSHELAAFKVDGDLYLAAKCGRRPIDDSLYFQTFKDLDHLYKVRRKPQPI